MKEPTREEKIFILKEAVKLGVPENQIDIRSKGYSIRVLLAGGRTTAKKLDEMYENVVKYRNNGQNNSKSREDGKRTGSLERDQTREKKVCVLKEAVEQGIPKNKIDIRSKGYSINMLLAGGRTTAKKLDEMYENVLKYRNNGSNTQEERKKPGLSELERKVKEQETEIATLKTRMEALEKIVQQTQEIKASSEKKKRGKKILGVPITQKTDTVSGRKYVRWYGYRNENGKRRWIYIGKDLSQAELKIQEFLSKEDKH